MAKRSPSWARSWGSIITIATATLCVFLLLLLLMGLTSCRTQVVPLNNVHRTDSAHLNTSAERDSVRHLHFRSEKQHPGMVGQPDTIVIFDSIVHEHHHYHSSRDTIVINHTDTIDRPVPVQNTHPTGTRGIRDVLSNIGFIGLGVMFTGFLILVICFFIRSPVR